MMENADNTVDAKKIVESLLFVSKRPVSISEIDEVTSFGTEKIEDVIGRLSCEYEQRGLQILRIANGYILATRPEFSPYVEKLLNSPVSVTLSHQSLETLSIIAYKQPVTKSEIESIRGVLCDGVIKTLLEKKLIKESGRGEGVGRPILYSTTIEFLKHFGLHDLGDLPRLSEGEMPKADMLTEEANMETVGV